MIKIDDRKFLEMSARSFGCAEWVWVRECEGLMLGELDRLQECYYRQIAEWGEMRISWEEWLESCTLDLIQSEIIAIMGTHLKRAESGSGLIIELICEEIEELIKNYSTGCDQDLRCIAEHINETGRWV